MFCKYCGAVLKEDAKFCGGCGKAVELPAPVVEEAAPVVETPAPIVEDTAPVTQEATAVVEVPTPVEEVVAPAVETPAPIAETAQVYAAAPIYTPPVQPTYIPPTPSAKKIITEADLPEQYRPLGAWSYFGLQMLFAVPIVGLVFLIIFTFKRDNLNRRAFARSYWCALMIVGILLAVALVFVIIAGIGMRSAFGAAVY